MDHESKKATDKGNESEVDGEPRKQSDQAIRREAGTAGRGIRWALSSVAPLRRSIKQGIRWVLSSVAQPRPNACDAIARWAAPTLFILFILIPLGAYFLDFIASPLAPLRRAFSSRQESVALLALFARTLGVAIAGATVALFLGMIVFAAFHSLPRRARTAAWLLAGAPLLIPAHFMAIAWIQTAGNAGWLTHALTHTGWAPAAQALPQWLYSNAGCAMLLSLCYYPIVLALTWAGWRTIGAAAVESGATLMRPGRLWAALLGGWMRPWLAMGWLMAFLLCLLNYSIPQMLRVPVFTVEIMMAYSIAYDPPRAMGLCVPLILAGLCAALALGRLWGRADWPAFARRGAEWPRLPAPIRFAFGGAGVALLTASIAVPVGSFLAMAGEWSAYESILRTSARQAVRSAGWSALAAAAVTALAMGLLAPRRPGPGLLYLMAALLALPGSVVGMAHIAFWNAPDPWDLRRSFYDSGLMLPLGAATLLTPIACAILWIRRRQTPPILEDLERMADGFPARRRWALLAPAMARPAAMALIFVFVLAFQELHAAILLAAPGQETLAIRAFTLLHYAPDRLVAAFCLISLATLAAGAGTLGAIAALLSHSVDASGKS